ncbi:zona pellucida sperm-binding protein 3-like isoform X2 [Myripristis murdjan]|uniref:zona pellucida sperm-binding protein 3-like isoform X2 n=1 Tax=Myripristis murdjan TaxID=586833 RepID=UPI001175D617|nr:zona pellucida sperm-binding protein 3-like isoform X2 [Myripristis murdjan]
MMLCIGILFSLSCGRLAQDSQSLGGVGPGPRLAPGRARQGAAPAGPAQEKQALLQPLAWRFPEPPAEEEPRLPPQFELRRPVPADSVSVHCGETSVRVEARRDLLGIGQPVSPEDVTLGGCPATGEDTEAQTLVFESELHGCGSRLTMSADWFSYEFSLLYTPRPLGNSPIVRTREAAVGVECRYQRRHSVSSEGLRPSWVPLVASEASEGKLLFSLRLMTDDWRSARPSSLFLLGELMRLEAAVQQRHHAALSLFVDACVATQTPNANTVPRYAFLGNHGCLLDGKLTGSSSHFLPRAEGSRAEGSRAEGSRAEGSRAEGSRAEGSWAEGPRLRFQVEAFRFQQDDRGQIYITCQLRAAAAAPVNAVNKACSFSTGWREASGRHEACSCCDTLCTGRPTAAGEWQQEISTGPIRVQERPLG